MNGMQNVEGAAAEVEAFCREQGWKFCFIGGLAVLRWGMPRLTRDVDLTVLTGFGGEARFIDVFLGRFAGRLQNARQFAIERRVLLLRTASGIEIDVALGAFPFEENSINRATRWNVNGRYELTTCCAEDLIVHKVFAGRDRDWADVESILIRQHGKLKMDLVRMELPPLLDLKEDYDALSRFERMVAKVALDAENDDVNF